MALESDHRRETFYVGGEYVENLAGGHMFIGQMYVERLTPFNEVSQPYPLVLIHGQAQSGTNFLNKPDGGRGWASWILGKGYEVYIIDQTGRGRSPWWPESNETLIQYPAEVVQKRFTACRKYGLWPQAALHTQWPGTGVMGDPIFDQFYAASVQALSSKTSQEASMQAAGAALLDRIGPAILLAHSQGGAFPFLWADVRPQLVKAIVSIEPSGPPFRDAIFSTKPTRPYGLTNVPLTYAPAPPIDSSLTPLTTIVATSPSGSGLEMVLQAPPARQLIRLAGIPVLLETGEASYHAAYDEATFEFLKQAGVSVEWLRLADVGIHGNGHMQFLEKNSDDIAEVLEAWIRRTVDC